MSKASEILAKINEAAGYVIYASDGQGKLTKINTAKDLPAAKKIGQKISDDFQDAFVDWSDKMDSLAQDIEDAENEDDDKLAAKLEKERDAFEAKFKKKHKLQEGGMVVIKGPEGNFQYNGAEWEKA